MHVIGEMQTYANTLYRSKTKKKIKFVEVSLFHISDLVQEHFRSMSEGPLVRVLVRLHTFHHATFICDVKTPGSLVHA